VCKKLEIKSKESSTVKKVRMKLKSSLKKREQLDIECIRVEIVVVGFGDFDY
jgi:hypothetical protein